MKKSILFLAFVCFTALAQGQYVVNYKRAADAYFENKEYYAAATFYKKALNITSDTALAIPYGVEVGTKAAGKKSGDYEAMIFKLAESSRLYKNFADAEKYYAIASGFEDRAYATALYYYGESLRANQKYDEAAAVFDRFIKANPASAWRQQAEMELASSRFAAQEMQNPRLVQLKKLPHDINSSGSNYAPVYVDALYFTSSRPIAPEGTTKVLQAGSTEALSISKKATPYLNTLYAADPVNTGNMDKVRVWQAELKRPAGVEFAAATLTPGAERMYFTAWRTEDVVKKYQIWFSSRKADNTWSDPVMASSVLNSAGNNKQPFVTSDGKILIFSSDRVGGQGGYDLWYCALRPDGSTGQAVNLGADVNSKGNDEAPYYNMFTKKLRFSSDGMVGLGGFDFYESRGDFVKWAKPVNMGYPFNSSKDDIYFAPTDQIGSQGFISSDRESLCCLEIFSVKIESIGIKGILTDCRTGNPVPDATVSLSSDEDSYTASTDATGAYSFRVTSRKPVTLKFEATGYFAKTINYSSGELAKADTLINQDNCITPFKVNTPIVLKNIYFEFNSAELNQPSMETLNGLLKVLNDNNKIKIELSAHTDNLGTDEYNMDLSQRRAQSCVTYLINNGIAPERLTAVGYGESSPIAPNQLKSGKDNPEGRAMNRRVEFKVLKEEAVR